MCRNLDNKQTMRKVELRFWICEEQIFFCMKTKSIKYRDPKNTENEKRAVDRYRKQASENFQSFYKIQHFYKNHTGGTNLG